MAATAVLFIGANHPQHGREKEAVAYWIEAGASFDRWQKAGHFERWDSFALTPHSGSTNFAFTLYGERAKLDELRRSDEFEAMVFKIMSLMTGVGVIPGVSGPGLAAAMARRDKNL